MYLLNMIWVKNFLEDQGYKIEENLFEQDKESAIKLEKKGCLSAGPKSRHISIPYFWMKTASRQQRSSFATVQFYQWSEIFFRRFRDVIMGVKHMDTLALFQPTLTEEGVGITRQSRDSRCDHMSIHTSNGSGTRSVPVAKKV